MKLGVMADSHDHVRNIRRALDVFRERGVEAILHAGDVVAPFAAKALSEFEGPVYVVYGNNDGERAGLSGLLDIVPPPRELHLAERVIVLAHQLGDVPDWMKRAADVVVAGHTHGAVLPEETEKREGTLVVNPGESGGWLTGKATCAVLDLGSMKAELCPIGEP